MPSSSIGGVQRAFVPSVRPPQAAQESTPRAAALFSFFGLLRSSACRTLPLCSPLFPADPLPGAAIHSQHAPSWPPCPQPGGAWWMRVWLEETSLFSFPRGAMRFLFRSTVSSTRRSALSHSASKKGREGMVPPVERPPPAAAAPSASTSPATNGLPPPPPDFRHPMGPEEVREGREGEGSVGAHRMEGLARRVFLLTNLHLTVFLISSFARTPTPWSTGSSITTPASPPPPPSARPWSQATCAPACRGPSPKAANLSTLS
jgi:hypothetical protein